MTDSILRFVPRNLYLIFVFGQVVFVAGLLAARPPRRALAIVRWHWSRGPLRLRAARLRRSGQSAAALVLLAGPIVLIETIRKFPHDLAARERCVKFVCRKLSAYRTPKSYFWKRQP